MALYYHYANGDVNGISPARVKIGSDPCAVYSTYGEPEWVDAITNGGKPRGLLPGVPHQNTELPPDGCYSYCTDGELIKPQTVVIEDARSITRVPYKEFAEKRKAGEIVLNPMTARRVTAKLVPGLPSDVNPVSTSTLMVRAYSDPEPHVTTCGYKYIHPTIGGIELKYPRLSTIWVDYGLPVNRHYDVFRVDELEMPPMSVVYEAHKQIAEYFEKHPHNGQLVVKAYSEANQGAWDVLTELAEFGKTLEYGLDLLHNIVEMIVKLKRDLKRAHSMHAAAAEIAERVATIWLQFRYAVKPVVYSIQDIIEYRKSIFTPYQTIRKGHDHELTLDLSSGWVANAPVKFRDRCYVKSMYQVDFATYNLTVSSARTFWEIFPLSWLIDFVISVGDFLTALSPPDALKNRGGMYSRQIVDGSIQIYNKDGRKGYIRLDATMYKADTITDPIAWVDLPFNYKLKWQQMLDVLALSWSRSKAQIHHLRG